MKARSTRSAKKFAYTEKLVGYPPEQGMRSGAKVGWLYYRALEDASLASERAKHNARIKAGEGYDFGYCSPGSVMPVTEGKFKGLYEVCIP